MRPQTLSLDQQIDAAQAEAHRRRKTFPHLVEQGLMTRSDALVGIAAMESIEISLGDLRAIRDHPPMSASDMAKIFQDPQGGVREVVLELLSMGLSQQDIEKRCGVKQCTVSAIKRGVQGTHTRYESVRALQKLLIEIRTARS